jgi:hypothetical protein
MHKGRIAEGMLVFSRDGERLGRVVHCEETSFLIEKGLFFPKDFVASYDDIAERHGDELILHRTRSELVELSAEPIREEAPHEQTLDEVGLLGMKPV